MKANASLCAACLVFAIACIGAGKQPVQMLRPVGDQLAEFDGAGRQLKVVTGHNNYKRVVIGRASYYIYLTEKGLIAARCTSKGIVRSSRQVSGGGIESATALMDVKVLSGGRVLADMHINPSTGVYVELNPKTGKSHTFLGFGACWDERQRHVAYFRDPPHFSRDPVLTGVLCVDGKEICKVQRDVGGQLAWKRGVLHARMVTPAGKNRLVIYDPKTGKRRTMSTGGQ